MNTTLAKEFLSASKFAVVGASTDRSKYGNKVLRWYLDRSMLVTPINPKASDIEGQETVKNLHELSKPQETGVSVITPPQITLEVLRDAERCRVPFLWLQPGAADEAVREYIEGGSLKDKVLYGGPCILRDGPGLLSKL